MCPAPDVKALPSRRVISGTMTESQHLFRYVALGDSTAVGVGGRRGGYPEHLFQALRAQGIRVGHLNLGRSGATTTDLVRDTLAAVPAKQPALVSLGIGTNDLWRMVPLEDVRANLCRIADGLEATGAEVLVSNVSDLSLAPVASMLEAVTGLSVSLFTSRLEALNEAIAELGKRPGFTLIDVCRFSRDEVPAHPEYFCHDGFHPSDEGYERWAQLLLPDALAAAERWRERTQTRTARSA